MKYIIFTACLFFSIKALSQAVPYNSAKKIDSKFYTEISKLKKVFSERAVIFQNQEPVLVELYTDAKQYDSTQDYEVYEKILEDVNDEGGYSWKTVLKVGEYYFPFELGLDYSFEIKNIVGSKNSEKEIVIYYGCLWQDPCLPQLNIVRIFKDGSFTFTYFSGEISQIMDRKHAMSKSEYDKYKRMGSVLISFYHYGEPKCIDEDAAYSISGKGFKKVWSKRKRTECAG